jgi:hypothetical protein
MYTLAFEAGSITVATMAQARSIWRARQRASALFLGSSVSLVVQQATPVSARRTRRKARSYPQLTLPGFERMATRGRGTSLAGSKGASRIANG